MMSLLASPDTSNYEQIGARKDMRCMPIWRAVIHGEYVSPATQTRTSFYIGGPGTTQAEAEECVNIIRTAWVANLMPVSSHNFRLTGASIQDMDTAGMPSIPLTFVPPDVGDILTEALPYTAPPVLTFRANSVPPNKAVKHIPGFHEGTSDNSVLLSAAQVALAGFGNDLIQFMPDAGTDTKLVCARLSAEGTVVISTNDVTSYRISNFLGTRKSRRPGRGI